MSRYTVVLVCKRTFDTKLVYINGDEYFPIPWGWGIVAVFKGELKSVISC